MPLINEHPVPNGLSDGMVTHILKSAGKVIDRD